MQKWMVTSREKQGDGAAVRDSTDIEKETRGGQD